ncbi:MAG: sugar phosphate isomerase/epimerase [Deltaproteobacteria bacterium]|nr:sugar phosphate isomerase/epimerase [Deltaproteobacteria bacterium]MBW2361688.1 sugar phosphate isomerase/epimerase [Deltaproteobacteria bacterium]
MNEPTEFSPRPIAINLFSVRRELQEDFEGCLRRLAEIGFVGIEPMTFGSVPPEALPEDLRIPQPEPRDFRRLLDDLGLEVASLHAPLPGGDDGDAVLDLAETLGTDLLVLSSWIAIPEIGTRAHEDVGALARVIELFQAASERAQRRGLRLGFHNHHYEWERDLAGHSAWELFWKDADPRVVAEVDIYWAQTARQDPVAVIEALGERVRRIHVKDGPCVLGEPQTALGRGTVDVAACVRAARHSDWHILELDDCATDMLTALAESYDYMVSRGLSLGRRPSLS